MFIMHLVRGVDSTHQTRKGEACKYDQRGRAGGLFTYDQGGLAGLLYIQLGKRVGSTHQLREGGAYTYDQGRRAACMHKMRDGVGFRVKMPASETTSDGETVAKKNDRSP
jgi:hypothetical protein